MKTKATQLQNLQVKCNTFEDSIQQNGTETAENNN